MCIIHVCCLVAKLCLTFLQSYGLYSLRGSSVRGISQARILEWAAISFSRGSSPPREGTFVSCLAGGFFVSEPGKVIIHVIHMYIVRTYMCAHMYAKHMCIVCMCVHAKSFQLCPTLCDPLDCNLLVSSVHEILQAGILRSTAMPSSRGSSQSRD